MSVLSKFQEEVGKWATETFYKPSMGDRKYSFCDGRVKHFMKEADELNKSNFLLLPQEAADCFLLLIHIAHIMEFDLLDEARKKMEINKKRTWGEPDEDGVIEHV